MNFNRENFFDGARVFLKSRNLTLMQRRVDALETLLSNFEADAAWKDVRHIAYAFATMTVETFVPRTGQLYEPVVESGANSYFKKYDGRVDLGNDRPGDGLRFKGRGYVQITGRKNYSKFGLQNEPEEALNPDIAFHIMTVGMFQGIFTGKKLSDYINSKSCDYKGARRIINGQDRASEIAGYAKTFERILRDSISSTDTKPVATANQPTENPADKTPSVAGESESRKLGFDSSASNSDGKQTKVSVTDGDVKVETSEGASEKEKVAVIKKASRLKSLWAKIVALFTGNSIFDGITEKAAQVQQFGLSASFWSRLFYFAVAATVVYLLYELYKDYQDKKQTETIVKANTTTDNKVILIEADKADEFKEKGYSIVGT